MRKQDGVWGIFIERDSKSKRQKERREGKRSKRAKTGPSYRAIPLHPLVIKAGFLRFAEARRQKGAESLFELSESRFGSRSSALSKRLNRMIDQAGIKDERLVFHSWRHTVRRRLRRWARSDLVLDMLTGHAPRTEGDKYGGVESAELLSLCREIVHRGVKWQPVIAAGPARARRVWDERIIA